MRRRIQYIGSAWVLVAVALAGCTGDPGGSSGPDAVDPDSFDLASGKGAIAGLLVDDRFRPIDLTDDPTTEFQAQGFILLQETGQQLQTNENGEFTFVDLEPGTYTLRVSTDGHEASPQQATVEPGLFTETTVIARRVVDVGSSILTQQHAMFIACAADYVANGGNLPCDLDFSNEAYSSGFTTNYTEFREDTTFMVTEMKANQENRWEIQIRAGNSTREECTTDRFAVSITAGVDYVRIANEYGVTNTDDEDNPGYCPNVPWWNDRPFSTIMFVDHDYREEHQTLPAVGGTFCCGVGASAGIKAQFLQSVFLGEPEVDVEAYCQLCT